MDMEVEAGSDRKSQLRVVRITHSIARHWLIFFILLFGIFNVLPFFAPVAMRLGWTSGGEAIYTIYSTMCHQMAQRSFFFFGSKAMYNLDELPVTLAGNASDMWTLRYFLGNETLGWKVAWSDRMVYMYGSIWMGAVIYALISRTRALKPIPLWLFILLMMPMIFDGITHLFSDVNGLMGGFRYDNRWLAELTNNSFPVSFYRGDALGSFNSWIRFFSGVSFGLGVVGLAFPFLDREFRRTERLLEEKLDHYYTQLKPTALKME